MIATRPVATRVASPVARGRNTTTVRRPAVPIMACIDRDRVVTVHAIIRVVIIMPATPTRIGPNLDRGIIFSERPS